ncbi:Polyisoprenoid-binding protein YceI [Actinomadura meyerae]|jgi:polyisoprenoid-binding protein YceI|uniref:Polyisoprenoid-binding protein YceI n=1 Tax=Actinomadura meyerae TaxID=240840 RepID=A0A239LVA4_9ACTN|nr:YceI family protein [Actinomadura meyerae]SNT34305.1 Polyisoprenoid-binding protein YceI [Actinomadura meyerae]
MGVEVSDLEAGRWSIDPVHSEITFTIRHLMTTVRGSFLDFGGEVVIGEDPLDSTARAEIRMASIDTRSAERDEHVRSADILDVKRHPVMMFTATGVEPATVGRRARSPRYHLDGELTIKDVTRPVRLLTEFHGVGSDPWGGTRAGFTATAAISRRDFGIEFNVPLQGDRVMLGDEITIGLEIQAVLATADTPA